MNNHTEKSLDRNYWEHFHHEADIGIRGVGSNVESVFEQAAMALTAIITDPESITPVLEKYLECSEVDLELLFVDWLNKLIYIMVTDNMLFSGFKVNIDKGRLQAHLYGEEIDRLRHEPAVEPKGATYTELKVQRRENGDWIGQCVIDV